MKDFERESRNPFNGFVSFFNKKNKFSNYITASGSIESSSWWPPNSVLSGKDCFSGSCQWASPGITNNLKSFLVFTFTCPTLITHYTLKTRTDDSENFPVSWKVEASIDNSNWYLIDKREDRNELTSKSAYYRYKCDNNNLIYAKYIRIWLSKTTSTKFHFHLSKVDFFGRMNIDKCSFPFNVINPPCTHCHNNHHTYYTSSLFLYSLLFN